MTLKFLDIEPHIREAGKLALSYFQTQLTRQRKDDKSPVTEADKAVEAFLMAKIRETYPDDDYEIVSEETANQSQGKEFTWVIDPIDGTRVFLDGLPSWCITVGLLRNGEAYRGIVYLPVVGEMYYTDNEGVAYWNGRPLAGMIETDWHRDSFIGVSSSVHRNFEIDFRRLRAFGSIASHHVYVARGVAVATLHRKVASWDIAGAEAILTAVGGVSTYLDGRPISMPKILADGVSEQPILAGHPKIVEKLLPKIKPLK